MTVSRYRMDIGRNKTACADDFRRARGDLFERREVERHIPHGFGRIDRHDHDLSRFAIVCGERVRGRRRNDPIARADEPRELSVGVVTLAEQELFGEVRDMTFDLSAFERIPASSAKVIRTSGAVNEGENWNEDIPAVAVRDKRLVVSLAPFSITTFVIDKEQ